MSEHVILFVSLDNLFETEKTETFTPFNGLQTASELN
jgi:hypothetical protein